MHRSEQSDHMLACAARFLLVVGGVALLSGCDAHKLTAPGASPPPERRTFVEPIGSAFLTAPPNSSPEAIASIAAQTVGTIPDSTWVVITVNGEIIHTWNPDCGYAPPSWPCQNGPVAYPFGAGPSTSGPLTVWAQNLNGWSPTRLRGVGGSSSTAAIGLHFQSTAGGMSAELNLMAKWAWNPNTGTGPFSYFLSGGYSVEAMPIASPIVVRDHGAGEAADPRRRTACTWILSTATRLWSVSPRCR